MAGQGGAGGGTPPLPPLTSEACTPGAGRKLYVSPAGSPQGDGKSAATAYDIQTARSAAMPGDTLLLQPGKYAVPYTEGAKNTLVFAQQGSAAQLKKEMRIARERCHRLIWLNPRLGSPGYAPRVEGMAAALEHVDDFLPCHNMRSLEAVARHLAALPRRRGAGATPHAGARVEWRANV